MPRTCCYLKCVRVLERGPCASVCVCARVAFGGGGGTGKEPLSQFVPVFLTISACRLNVSVHVSIGMFDSQHRANALGFGPSEQDWRPIHLAAMQCSRSPEILRALLEMRDSAWDPTIKGRKWSRSDSVFSLFFASKDMAKVSYIKRGRRVLVSFLA